jgi:RimJ/RimL family protein N-acetyltransferase
MRAEVRPSIPSDFDRFLDKPLPYRVRAITGLVDSEILAVGGIAYLPDGTHGGFLIADERARKYPIALHKAGLGMLRQARRLGITKLVAIADENIKPAKAWLERLGFEPVTVDDQEVWIWHSSSHC